MEGTATSEKNRILIVANDFETLDTIKSYLDADYLTGTVAYGKFVMEYLQNNTTDLILMDAADALTDDFGVLKSIRRTDFGADIPVIFMTDKSDRNLLLDSISMGVDGYLIKPVEPKRLITKIREIISHKINMATRKTILTVDDDVTYLKIIENALKDNFNVVMVNSSKLALDYLESHKPDVIILDYQMPEIRGSRLLEHIRAEERFSATPVIMLTGISDRTVIMECMGLNPDKFLLKPVSKLDLLRAIISSLSDRGKGL